MKQYSTVNFNYYMTARLHLTTVHLLILDWLITFASSGKMFNENIKDSNGKLLKYFWVNYQKIIDDYTYSDGYCLLGFTSRRTLARYMNDLCSKELLYKTTKNSYTDKNNYIHTGTFTFYAINYNAFSSLTDCGIVKEEMAEEIQDDKVNMADKNNDSAFLCTPGVQLCTGTADKNVQTNIVKLNNSLVKSSSSPVNFKDLRDEAEEKNTNKVNTNKIKQTLKELFKTNELPFNDDFCQKLVLRAECAISPDFNEAENGKKNANGALKGLDATEFLCYYLKWHHKNCNERKNLRSFASYFYAVAFKTENFLSFVSYLNKINPSKINNSSSLTKSNSSSDGRFIKCPVCGSMHRIEEECKECGTSIFSSKTQIEFNRKLYSLSVNVRNEYKKELESLNKELKTQPIMLYAQRKAALNAKYGL